MRKYPLLVGEVANKRYCKVSDHGDEFSFIFYFLKILVGATDLFASCKATGDTKNWWLKKNSAVVEKQGED
jgi:hypothetical protein